jgi:hypothetical protein
VTVSLPSLTLVLGDPRSGKKLGRQSTKGDYYGDDLRNICDNIQFTSNKRDSVERQESSR